MELLTIKTISPRTFYLRNMYYKFVMYILRDQDKKERQNCASTENKANFLLIIYVVMQNHVSPYEHHEKSYQK